MGGDRLMNAVEKISLPLRCWPAPATLARSLARRRYVYRRTLVSHTLGSATPFPQGQNASLKPSRRATRPGLRSFVRQRVALVAERSSGSHALVVGTHCNGDGRGCSQLLAYASPCLREPRPYSLSPGLAVDRGPGSIDRRRLVTKQCNPTSRSGRNSANNAGPHRSD